MRLLASYTLYFIALGVACYAIFVYAFLPLGSLVHPDMMAVYQLRPAGIYLHVFASAIALILGPFQFLSKFQQTNPVLHRWMGRTYLGIGVLIGGIAGLYMAAYAYGGHVAQLGFATLAVLWLYTGSRAYTAIRSGNVSEHRRWMIRNFSLTLAAVTLRLYLPFSMATGVEFALAYQAIAWLCWIPNLVIAEWWFVRSRADMPGSASMS